MTHTSSIAALSGIALILLGFGCAENSKPVVVADATYKNDAGGYQVTYPEHLKVLDAAIENADIALGFGDEYFAGTNLSEAAIRVAARHDEYLVSCLLHPFTNLPLTETAMLNGVKFHLFDVEDAGAGQRYYYRGYRVLQNNTCYTLDLEAHSTNPEMEEPTRPREFNKREVVGIFDALAQSFKFIK